MALNPKQCKLTAKEAKFVQEYLVDLSATGAAKRAGYSEKTAFAIGFENLRKPKIQEAIQVARQELATKSGITPEKVIKGFAAVAFHDPADFYNADGSLKNIHDIPKEARMALAGLDVDELWAGPAGEKENIGQTKKVKFSSRHQHLDSLAKHFGLYDADRSNKAENKFILIGMEGASLDDAMKTLGVVEIKAE